MKLISDMRRIRHMLQPFRSVLKTRKLYREYYNMLNTLWTCCPLQRIFLFDRRDVHQTLADMATCLEHITYNRTQLSNKCLTNLKIFNPVTTELPKCDGGLFRNMVNQYTFIVELYNYTKRFCVDGLHPNLIFFDISNIIQCERAIRQKLISNPRAYNIYDNLSNNVLNTYIQNLHKYYECDDPELLKNDENEEDEYIKLIYQY